MSLSQTKKDLIVFIAHLDDFECSCYGYVFKHYGEYENIKIITASMWEDKRVIWQNNLEMFPAKVFNKIEDINLLYI